MKSSTSWSEIKHDFYMLERHEIYAAQAWLRLSEEEQVHCSASEKYLNYINGGGLSVFCEK